MCQIEVVEDLRRGRPSVEQIARIGMDTSKHVFQLHGVNAAEEPVLRKKLRRKEMERFFEKLPPTLIAIEACGGSHHWARRLRSIGHEVKLIPPQCESDLKIDPTRRGQTPRNHWLENYTRADRRSDPMPKDTD